MNVLQHEHIWIPCRRYPQLAVCCFSACEARGRWSVTLGKHIRIIPESHIANGEAKHLPGKRKHYERPRA